MNRVLPTRGRPIAFSTFVTGNRSSHVPLKEAGVVCVGVGVADGEDAGVVAVVAAFAPLVAFDVVAFVGFGSALVQPASSAAATRIEQRQRAVRDRGASTTSPTLAAGRHEAREVNSRASCMSR